MKPLKIFAALLGLVMLFSSAASPASASSDWTQPWRSGEPRFSPPTGTTPIVGAVYHGVWADRPAAVRRTILSELAAAGVEYVRLDVAWASLQPDGPKKVDTAYAVPMTDQRIAEIAAHGMRTLLLLHWPPKWSSGTSARNGVPRDPGEFARIAAWAAARWRSDLVGIEIMNEPDSPSFLATTDPLVYTQTVVASYDAIKRVAPEVKVVAGAPMYVDTNWYRQFFELGGAGHYDALGVHPYLGLSDAPPATCDQYAIEYYPCNIPNLIALMAANGDADKAIWATEYGWSSHDNSGYEAPVPNWKRGVTEQQQAQYLLDMQSLLSSWPQVQASFWYAAWNKNTGDPQEDNWGLLTRDFRRKPVFYAMRCAASGVCGPSTSTPLVPVPEPIGPGAPPAPDEVTAPGRVTRLRVAAAHKHNATIRWRAPAKSVNVDGFRVRWAAKKSPFHPWRYRTVTRSTLHHLRPGTRYRVEVAALNGGVAGKKTALTFRHRARSHA